jgi:hypothetical protein
MTQTTLLLSRLSLCLFFLLIPLLVVIEFQRPPQRPVLPALLIAYRIDLLCWLYFSGVTYFVLMQYSTQHRLVLSLVIAEPFISLFNPERGIAVVILTSCVLNVALCAAPIVSKDVQNVSFSLLVPVFLWTLYGFRVGANYLVISNAVAFVLVFIQFTRKSAVVVLPV